MKNVKILETKKYIYNNYYEEFWIGNFKRLPKVMGKVQSSLRSPVTLDPSARAKTFLKKSLPHKNNTGLSIGKIVWKTKLRGNTLCRESYLYLLVK